DLVLGRGQVAAGDGVGQGAAVPGFRERGIREVREHLAGAGGAEYRGAGRAVERGELRLHADHGVALQHGAPQVGGELVGDAALFADRGARVAAHGRGRGGVVEADARCVHVDRDDGGRGGGAAGEGRGGEGAG